MTTVNPILIQTPSAPLVGTRWRLDVRWLIPLRLLLALSLPLLAALALFGWRVGAAWLMVLLGGFMGRAMIWRMQSWVATPGRVTLVAHSLLITLFFPATLLDIDQRLFDDNARWPALLGAGMLLSLTTWIIRRSGTARFHPVPLTLLLMAACGAQLVQTHRVLQREDAFAGDVLDRPVPRSTATAEPWYGTAPVRDARVWEVFPAASERLSDFLHGVAPIGRPPQTISRLVSDDLPPLEDLVIGGHPTRAGCASAVAIMIGGLFLIYRGVVSFRVPLLMLAACYVAMMILPMPTVVGQDELTRRWLVPFNHRVGWAMGITLIHYIFAASPILLTTLMLAVLPGIRPIGLRAGGVYAILFGVLCAVCTVFVSFNYGAILALSMTQLLTPTLDRRLPSRAAI